MDETKNISEICRITNALRCCPQCGSLVIGASPKCNTCGTCVRCNG